MSDTALYIYSFSQKNLGNRYQYGIELVGKMKHRSHLPNVTQLVK